MTTSPSDFYNLSSKDYKTIHNNITSFINDPSIQELAKHTHTNPFNISPPLQLSLTPEMIHNPISKDHSPLLHADIVNSYIHLLKNIPTSSQHIFFTTDYIDYYNYKLNDFQKKEYSTSTNKPLFLRNKRLDHLALFLTSYGIKRKLPHELTYARQQLLDNVFDTIETYYNPKPKKRKTSSSPPLIFFPIFLNKNHFALAVLDIHKHDPQITYYDSLLGIDLKITPEPPMTKQADKYLNLIVELLSNYFFNFKDISYQSIHPNTTHFFQNVILDIIQLDPPEMPQQPNGVDCGVYVCALTYLIANNYKIPSSFTDQQIQNIRLRIKQLIVSFSPHFPRDHHDDDPFIITDTNTTSSL